MKKTIPLIIAAIAIFGASCQSGSESAAPQNDAVWGTVDYYYYEIDKLGLVWEGTDGEAVRTARDFCDLVTMHESGMTVFEAAVSGWQKDFPGDSLAQSQRSAAAMLEINGYVVVTPTDAADFRDRWVEDLADTANAISGSTGNGPGEAWTKQLSILGDCAPEWNRLVLLDI